jgi:hypothetical protein
VEADHWSASLFLETWEGKKLAFGQLEERKEYLQG